MSRRWGRPHPAPPPRPFADWLEDLGLEAEGSTSFRDEILTYDEFCSLPGVRLFKRHKGALYGWWRQHPDVDPKYCGEDRTVREWLTDFDWELIEPTREDLAELDLFVGHDEFWEWSIGKVETPRTERRSPVGMGDRSDLPLVARYR